MSETFETLNQALAEREQQELSFFHSLIDEMNEIIKDLQLCDTSKDPEVGDSLVLSTDELNKLITRIKSDMNETQMAQDVASNFDAKSKEFQLRKVAKVATPNTPAPSVWNRMFGQAPRPVAPARPVAPRPAPRPVAAATPGVEPSFWDRMLGQRPVDRTDRSRAQWSGYAQHPDSVPNATPVYQAEPYPYAEVATNPYGKGGTRRKRKVRKSRRKV